MLEHHEYNGKLIVITYSHYDGIKERQFLKDHQELVDHSSDTLVLKPQQKKSILTVAEF